MPSLVDRSAEFSIIPYIFAYIQNATRIRTSKTPSTKELWYFVNCGHCACHETSQFLDQLSRQHSCITSSDGLCKSELGKQGRILTQPSFLAFLILIFLGQKDKNMLQNGRKGKDSQWILFTQPCWLPPSISVVDKKKKGLKGQNIGGFPPTPLCFH